MRIKSKWHKTRTKTTEEIGGALAFISWRLTRNHLEDLLNEGFYVEKNQLFDVVAEYLCFLIQCTDRIIFARLDDKKRHRIIQKLTKQCAFYFQENKADRIGDGDYIGEFVHIYNLRVADYSQFDFDNEPSYPMLKYFAEKIACILSQKENKWISQQMIEIQAPKAFEKLAKSVDDLVSVNDVALAKKSAKKTKIRRARR